MDQVHGVVHGSPWTGSMGWSMDPGPCFLYVPCRTLLDVSYPLCCKLIVAIKHILGLADQRAHASTFECADCVVKAKFEVCLH